MINAHTRKFAVEAVVLVIALFGLWSFIVGPMRGTLGKARSVHDAAMQQSRIIADPLLSVPEMVGLKERYDRAIDVVNQRSRPVFDQTVLHATLMRLGEDAGVQIDRINPARTVGSRKDGIRDLAVSYEIECSGGYRDIVAFFDTVESQTGFAVINRFTMRPDPYDDEAVIRVILTTTHYSFDTSPQPVGVDGQGAMEGV